MKQGFRQSMAWLHTWVGLLTSWLLLMIFMAGTASYYKQEITRWMRPELPSKQVPQDVAAANAVKYLQANAADAEYWHIQLPDTRNPAITMYWFNPAPKDGDGNDRAARRARFQEATVDASSGQAIQARDTRGGEFLYRLHFDLHYIPVLWARYIAGFCAMFMLVAIISGVITHKKIFKDFFTFRPRKGQRSWLDFHNVSAVMALPYHLMITYTGIVTLMVMYLPWGIKAAYPDGEQTFYTESFSGLPEARAASGTPARMQEVAALMETARAQWNGAEVASLRMDHPNDAAASLTVTQRDGKRISTATPMARLDAISGQLLERSGEAGGATATREVLLGLHLAHFADAGLRMLFFVSGLLGCLMVASGCVLWAIKERGKHAKSGRVGFGLRLVDALNIGAVAGLPIAFAAYFWANRLIPLDTLERPQAEISMFFVGWGAALLVGLLHPRRQSWAWLLYLASAMFVLLPVLNAVTTDAHLGVSIPAGDWVLAGFDLIVLALGLCLGYCGWRMQRWQPPVSAADKRRRQAASPSGTGNAQVARDGGVA
jgi:uncharacterized iron-regulated membrane protein